jgi:urease beta subunit
MKVGEIISKDREIIINEGRKTISIKVANIGDRPIQIGSHFHFFEVNKLLSFNRKDAFGMRLNIPSGTSVRFEPGEEKKVSLVELGGKKQAYGLNALTQGEISEITLEKSLETAKKRGFIK